MANPTPEEIASADQSVAVMADMFPALWWGLYKGCVDRGFSEPQALACVLSYISTSYQPPVSP